MVRVALYYPCDDLGVADFSLQLGLFLGLLLLAFPPLSWISPTPAVAHSELSHWALILLLVIPDYHFGVLMWL